VLSCLALEKRGCNEACIGPGQQAHRFRECLLHLKGSGVFDRGPNAQTPVRMVRTTGYSYS